MDKRARILDAAIALFLQNGIEKTTISHIVKKAGIAQGTFYLYFDTKLAVMPAIAEQMVATIHEKLYAFHNEATITEKMTHCVDVLFSNTSTYKELTKLVYTGFTQTEEVTQWETIYKPLYDWVYEAIVHAKKAGTVQTAIDGKAAARIIVGAIESTAEQIYLFDEAPVVQVTKMKESLVQFIVQGLCVSEKPSNSIK